MSQGLKGLIELLSLYFKGFTPVEFVRGNDRITQHASGWRVNGSGHLERAKDAVAYLEQAPAEEWRQVYCGINLFLVSDRGNVKKHDGTPAETFVLNGRVQIKYQIVKFGRLRNREIYRSHLVAMAFLNYQRGDEREIHHINGYRMDDSVANLVVLSREDHAKVHAFGATAPTGPVEDGMPLPKQRAKKGAKAPRGKHVGAPTGPGYVDFNADAASVADVPSVEGAEGERTAEGAPVRSSKRRRGKSTAKRRVEQRRAEEEAKEVPDMAKRQPAAADAMPERRKEVSGTDDVSVQADGAAELAGVSSLAAVEDDSAKPMVSIADVVDEAACVSEEPESEREVEGNPIAEGASVGGEFREEGRKRPRRHRGGRRHRRKRADGETADVALSAAIDSAEEAVVEESEAAGQDVAASVAEGERQDGAAVSEAVAAQDGVAVAGVVAAQDDSVTVQAVKIAVAQDVVEEGEVAEATAVDVADVDDAVAADGDGNDDDEFPMPTDVADDPEPFAAEVVDEISGAEEAERPEDRQAFAEDVQASASDGEASAASEESPEIEDRMPIAHGTPSMGSAEDSFEGQRLVAERAQTPAEEARKAVEAVEAAAEHAQEAKQEQDWGALRERFTDELDRFLSGFTDKDAAAGGDAAGKARGRQVKAVYGALRPFHSCDDAVMLFDTALAGVRRLNLFATERDEKAPGVAVGVLSQMNHLLKCACEQLAGADDVARACAVELLEEEAASPVYRKLGYAAKLRKCARTIQDGVDGTEAAGEAARDESANGDDSTAQVAAASGASRPDEATTARRRPRHRRRRPGKRERARHPRPDVGEASGRRGSAAVGGATSPDEN